MTQLHQYYPIEQATAGMVLADEVLDKQGHILLPARTVLTDVLIRSLAQHAVTQVSVLLEQSPEMIEQHQQELQKKIDRLPLIFRRPSENPATEELRAYLQQYRTGSTT